jgi:hypothetical protein
MIRRKLVLITTLFLLVSNVYAQRKTIYDSPDLGGDILDFKLSASGELVYFANNKTLFVFDLAQGASLKEKALQNDEKTTSIAISEKVAMVFIGKKDGSLIYVNLESGEEVGRVNLGNCPITSLLVTCGENDLWVSTEKGFVFRLSTSHPAVTDTVYKCKHAITSLESLCNHQKVAASTSGGDVLVFTLGKDVPTVYPLSSKSIRGMAYNTMSQVLYSADDGGRLRMLRMNRQGVLYEFDSEKVSFSWLTTVGSLPGNEGVVYGGLDQRVHFMSKFAKQSGRMPAPVIKAAFYEVGGGQINLLVSLFGKGLVVVPLKDLDTAVF